MNRKLMKKSINIYIHLKEYNFIFNTIFEIGKIIKPNRKEQ